MTHRSCISRFPSRFPGQGGVTLIESLIACTLLALAVTFVVSIIPSSVLSQRRAERRIHAGNLAQALLDVERLGNRPDQSRAELSREKRYGVEFVSYLTVSPARATDGAVHQKVKTVRVDTEWEEGERSFVIFREAVVLRNF